MSFSFNRFFPAVAAALVALTALPGCFTGVERTPVIKDNTPKSTSKVKLSDEQLLMEPVVPQPPRLWPAGKQFLISEGRLDYAFSPIATASKLHAGDTVYFSQFRSAVRLSGDSITEVIMLSPTNEELIYKIESPKNQILKENTLSIPFTIDLDLVNSARNRIQGNRVWTLKPGESGLKFQPFEIIDVLPGNSDYPFRVALASDTLLMVPNSSSSATSRTFAKLFTLTDPRKLHPEISDQNWQLICRGRVALDMTREECRLSVGAPAQIERTALPSGLIERWIYEDGVYLVFTDGLLTSFRQ